MAVATDGSESRGTGNGTGAGEAVLGYAPLTLANAISLGRLLLALPMVWLVASDRLQPAFWLFLLGGASDALDGFVAKRFGGRSKLGGYLDPLADKVLLTSVYVALASAALLPVWLVALVLVRDGLIVAGVLALLGRGRALEIEPLLLGKLNTLLQIVLAAAALAAGGGLFAWPELVDGLVYAVAASTAASGLAYLAVVWRGAAAAGRAP